jgi:hypothetical protein
LQQGLSTLNSTELVTLFPDRAARMPSVSRSSVWMTLRAACGSGVSLRELASLADTFAALTPIPRPSRETRRQLRFLIEWFENSWAVIAPFVPLVHLRDERGRVIDGMRELRERAAIGK